jgi:hypothetical protein
MVMNSLKKKLTTKEKEKATLQHELDKERDFQIRIIYKFGGRT